MKKENAAHEWWRDSHSDPLSALYVVVVVALGAPASAARDSIPRPLARRQGSADAANESEQCMICMDKAKATVMVPCGHECACVPCVLKDKPTTCYYCHQPITDAVLIRRVS